MANEKTPTDLNRAIELIIEISRSSCIVLSHEDIQCLNAGAAELSNQREE